MKEFKSEQISFDGVLNGDLLKMIFLEIERVTGFGKVMGNWIFELVENPNKKRMIITRLGEMEGGLSNFEVIDFGEIDVFPRTIYMVLIQRGRKVEVKICWRSDNVYSQIMVLIWIVNKVRMVKKEEYGESNDINRFSML